MPVAEISVALEKGMNLQLLKVHHVQLIDRLILRQVKSCCDGLPRDVSLMVANSRENPGLPTWAS